MATASSTPITLLSAPAGFGKTTLLAGWLSELDEPWAWLSIDELDNDPGRLWAHIIAALQTLTDPIGDTALVELCRHGGHGPIASWLTPLINDLAVTSAPDSFLVLDDIHLLTDADQRAGLAELSRHLPGWLHLVLSTRSDPPLPLPRLRADGRITEVRLADLRFAAGEARSLLATGGGTGVTDRELELLVERTDGWAAGLQLATIALADHGAATPARPEDIVGDLRPFTDYLITEVVDRQPAGMRDFLFATSIVDRVNPSLAHALSGAPDADRLLRQAEQEGLFLVALDGRDEWYRYHHLFAEALRHEMRIRRPEAADEAHSVAARWFEAGGDAASALEHWLAAGRPDEALRLGLEVGLSLVDRGQAITIEGIARRIPASVPGDDADRQLDYALLHLVFDSEAFLAWVGRAGATIGRLDEPGDDLVTKYLTVRSMADLSVGAWDDALTHAREAVRRGEAHGDPVGYAQRARMGIIRAAGWLECLDEAEIAFRAYVDDPSVPVALRSLVAPAAWALAAALGGRIDEADRWSTHATAAGERGLHNPFSAADLLLTAAIVARERGDDATAEASIETLRTTDFRANLSLRAVAEIELAQLRIGDGRIDNAQTLLDSALQLRADGTLSHLVAGRVDATRSALCVTTGDLIGARTAAERMPNGVWKQVALATALLAGNESVHADEALRRLTPATPRQRVVIEMLRALATVDRDPAAATDHIVDALQTATAAGLHRTVISVGPGVADLIDKASWAVPPAWLERAHATLAAGAIGPAGRHLPGLVEQLTTRERDALRYLPSRLTVPEIARELGVSPNTLKTHLKSLYRKLGVTTRDEAVSVGRQLTVLR